MTAIYPFSLRLASKSFSCKIKIIFIESILLHTVKMGRTAVIEEVFYQHFFN